MYTVIHIVDILLNQTEIANLQFLSHSLRVKHLHGFKCHFFKDEHEFKSFFCLSACLLACFGFSFGLLFFLRMV